MGSLPKTLPANFFDSSDSLPKTLPANFFDNGEQQTPLIPTVATPKPSPGPSMQQMDWVREQARRTPPPPPPPVAAAQAPLRPPTPIPANPLQAPTSAIRPEAPGNIAPTVVTSPTGQSAPPIPGRIPGMERLGGKAPGVPRPAAQINETNAPSLAGDVGGGFVRGVASGAMAVPRALSRVPGGFRDDINSLRRTRADIEPNLGFRTPEQVAKDDARLRQISNSDINRFEQAALPAAPVTGAGKFAEALGSTAPYMAAGVAGPAGPAALGILAGTEESLGRSDASGIPLTDAQRLGVGAAGAAIGSTEALPFGRLLGRLKGAGVIADAVDETQLVKQLFPGLKDYAVSAGKQAIEEGVQEGTSNVLQDVTEASYGGRPVNRIGEGLGDSVTTGGGVGALVDVLTTLAGSRAGRARLSQNGVDPVALMAWVQAQEVSPSMTAEFDALARENRRPIGPPASTSVSTTSPSAASAIPPPPPGFEIDVPPPAPRIDPADAPAIVPPQAEVAPLPPPPSIPEVEDQPAADSAIEYNDIEENQAHLPAGGEPQISPIEVPAQVRDVKPVNGIYDYSGSTDAEIESSVRSRFRNSILSEEEILGQVELEKRLRDYSKQSAMEVIEAEKEWEWTKPLGDLPVVSAKDLGSKQWLHGTSPEGKLAIANSGKFEPSKGKRFYDYSQFGPDTTYLTTEDSFWFQDPDGARAVRYPNQISVSLSPEARVALIRNESDTKALANKLGFESWNSLERILTVDGLKDTPTEQSLQRLRSSRDLVSRLTSEGIDAIYIYPHDAFDGPASQQLAVFNNNVIKPNLSQVPAPGPRKEVVQPETVDAAAPVADWNERSYQDAQDRIDAFEDELEKKGVNLSRLLSRDMDLSIMPPDWSYQPQELSDLYKQRDAIGEYEDSMLRSEIGRRLEPLVGSEKAKLLASKMMELDRLPANRTANNKNNYTQYGVIANEALKTAMEESGDEGRWVSVDAVLGGDANNPGVQLRLHRASGYDLPSKATFARAQQILDAALEGDAPRIPTEEPYRPSYANREPQQISSPVEDNEPDIPQPVPESQQAPPVDPGPVEASGPAIDRFHAAYQKLTGENYGKAITLSDVQQEMGIDDPAEFTRMLADIDRGPGITSDGAKLALPASTGTKGNNVYRDGDTSYYGIRFDRDTSHADPGPVEAGSVRKIDEVGVIGRRAPAKTARGYKVETNFAVVPMSSLRISNSDNGEVNPNYPGELQPRQRDRKSSDEQIQVIISQFDPDQLAENYLATDGAPIIGEDLAVESGNGRSMALRRIYERFPEKAKLYKDWLVENADRFGLDPEDLAGIENPVLVRVRKTLPKGISRTDFGRDANERTTGGMSPAEQAAIDARGLDPEIMRLFKPSEDGKINTMANAPFVRAFFASIVPVNDRGPLRDGDGDINPAGIKRIENAIFAKAYGDRGMIEKMAEDPDDNIKSVVGAMLSAANRFISMRNAIENGDLHSRDIAADLTAAAKILSNQRFEGKSIDDYLNQVDMFGRPKVQDAILATLRDLGRSKAKFLDILNRYVDTVEAAGNPKQEWMFGPTEPPPSPLAIWGSIVEREQANGQASQDATPQGGLDASRSEGGDGSGKSFAKKGRRAEGEQGPSGKSADSGLAGSTVEKTKDGLQETLVTDIEARESQIAARNDRTRPLAEVPFSLVAEEAPKPTGPDERQESMFGDDSEIASYAPGGESVAAKTSKPSSPKPPAAHGSMVSRSAIVKDLSAILNDIPIRQGLFREPGALGIFKTRQGVIRTKKALDLPTIAHEIGHAIHKRIWGIDAKNPNKLNSGPLRKFKKELGPLDYDPQQSRPFEGFAEYIRLALTEPATAQKRAPQFHAWFQGELAKYPELSGTLDKIAERIQDWEQQPAPVKLAASINVTPETNTFWSRFVSFAKDTKYELVDDKIDLKKTVELFKRLGADVGDTANSYRLARMANASYTRAHHSLMEGTVGWDYKVNGKGLKEILKSIATRKPSEINNRFAKLAKDWNIRMANDGMDDLRMYLVARRLQDYMKRGLDTGFTDDQLQYAINSTKTPDIVKAADEIHNFQNRVLDYVTDKGAMSPESVDWIRANNEFYVPLYRVMDDAAGKALLGRKMIDLNSPVMKRRGSQREIIDPLESIVRNTYTLYSFADRNEVAATLVKQAARVQDQGALIESGIVMPMKRTELSLDELKPQIEAAMEEAGIEIPEDLDLDVVAAIFRPNMDPQRSRGIVRVIVDGKPELFKMDPTLIRALDSMDKASTNMFVRLVRPFKNLLTFGATAGNPEFVITNWLRDQVMAGIQSRNGYVPFIHGWYGAFKMLADKKLVEEWTLNGGASSAIMPLTRDNLRLSVDKMTMNPKDLVLRHPAQLFGIMKDVLTAAGTYSEQSTRLAEFALAKKKGKSNAEAALDSRDVTLDFERMGKTARSLNEMIPFFAVSLNAMDRFAEMHNPRNPALFKRALTIGAGMAMASLSLWMINKDDEDYKAIEDWKRDLFWLIPTKPFGLEKTFGPFIRIAKPPLWGQLYASMIERWADSLYNHNPYAFEGFASTVWQQVFPPASVQAIRPIFEVEANYNDFTDRPIESQAMQRLSPENRYTASTSEAAKKMSKAFKSIGIEISPVKVEHLMLGYTAGAGRFIVTTTEEISGLRDDRPAMGPADIPILRSIATPQTPFISTDYKRYDQRTRKLKQRRNDAKLTGKKSDGLSAKESEDLKKLERLGRGFSQIRAQQYANANAVKTKKLTREQARDANDALAKKRESILRKNRHLFNVK